MKTSESIKEIAAAMNKAQAHMTAAKKDANNTFFKSKYADLGSVILALKEAFADNGLCYTQSPVMDGNAVGVTTRIMHISGEWLEGTLTIPLTKLDPQGAGSAITYARRYALQSMAGVPAADDDAEFAMGRKSEQAPAKPEFISEEQKQIIINELAKAQYPLEGFLKNAGVSSLAEVKESWFKRCLTHIQTVAQGA